MNQNEKELILQLSKFQNTNTKKISKLLNSGCATPEVLGFLLANRMAGVAYNILYKSGLLSSVDREFRNTLKNASLINTKINYDYIECVKYVSSILDACGVNYALLKGAFLCDWYPSGCRTSNDIDVLIAPEDVSKASAQLKLAGFEQGYIKNDVFIPATRQQIIESKMMRGETVPFIKKVDMPFMKYLEVDLNFSLDYKNGDANTLKEMLNRTQITAANSISVRTLAPCDFLLHLCAHLYKEATTVPWIRMKRDMTLYKYCDIYALLSAPAFSELDIISESKKCGLEKELAYCLYSINKFWKLNSRVLKRYITSRDNHDLDEVIAPTEKKIYRYSKSDPRKRFFAKDRMKLIKED